MRYEDFTDNDHCISSIQQLPSFGNVKLTTIHAPVIYCRRFRNELANPCTEPALKRFSLVKSSILSRREYKALWMRDVKGQPTKLVSLNLYEVYGVQAIVTNPANIGVVKSWGLDLRG